MSLEVLFMAATIRYNLPAGLLESLCYVESKHQVWAVHVDDGGSDSIGICQVKKSTARTFRKHVTTKQLFTPEINIDIAARYLKHQIVRYHSVRKAVIAYNLGHAAGLTHTKYQVKVYKQWEEWRQQQ